MLRRMRAAAIMRSAVLTFALFISGCVSAWNPSAEKLGNGVAGTLGVRPGDVRVSDIRRAENRIDFIATTSGGVYECSQNSGFTAALWLSPLNRRCIMRK